VTQATPPTVPTPAAEPTHPCIRCGRPGVPVDKALCEQCNPADLAQPSATQVHGIAVLGILVFVAIMAVAGRAALAGTGPFTGAVLDIAPAPSGLVVTMSVHNAGSKAGATTCRIIPDSRPAGVTGDLVQTPQVPAGGDARFSAVITRLGPTPIGLVADCQSP
jgi:hypothetical protein